MITSEHELEKIAALACIETDANSAKQFAQDVNAIMDFVAQLRTIDTNDVAPLFHPLDLNQRLRSDVIQETPCTTALAKTAPLFENDLYLVPKVIETGK